MTCSVSAFDHSMDVKSTFRKYILRFLTHTCLFLTQESVVEETVNWRAHLGFGCCNTNGHLWFTTSHLILLYLNHSQQPILQMSLFDFKSNWQICFKTSHILCFTQKQHKVTLKNRLPAWESPASIKLRLLKIGPPPISSRPATLNFLSGWVTHRKPRPRWPASQALSLAYPRWSCAFPASPCWTETRSISLTPASSWWYRTKVNGPKWVFLFSCSSQ